MKKWLYIVLSMFLLMASTETSAVEKSGVSAKRAARTSSTVFRSFTKSNFRTNLGRLTGKVPANSQAHHVFPQKFANNFAGKVNIHDPKFGSWWNTSGHLKNARAYNQAWENFFIKIQTPLKNPNATTNQILNQGRSLMNRYGIPVNF